MNYNVISYLVYLVVTICLTIWVAQTLLKNGKVFLKETFKGDMELAGNVSKLLQVGFYLINIGYVFIALTIASELMNLQSMIEKLSIKIGSIVLTLGVMHFFNLFVLFRLKGKPNH